MDLNSIYFMDMFEGIKNIADESIDAVITDPPYLINYKHWDKTNMDFEVYADQWLKECFRVLKPSGTLWSFMGFSQVFKFVPLLNKYGNCNLDNWVIVQRSKGRSASHKLKSTREDLFHVTKDSKNYTWNNIKVLREVIAPYVKDGRPRGWFLLDVPNDENLSVVRHRVRWTGLGNVWNYSFPQHNSICEKQIHPAQKPVMLIERLIRLSTNENEIVLDPFMGSGTTAIACKICNRQYIGFENNRDIYNSSMERIRNFDISKFTQYNATLDKILQHGGIS